MGYVYILILNNGQYYIGSTNSIDKRLEQHKNGKVISTKGKLPFMLKFVKTYNSLEEARRVEYHIKKMKSRKFIENFMGD